MRNSSSTFQRKKYDLRGGLFTVSYTHLDVYKRHEYGMNPDKTEGGALISAFACEPETAVSEFALSKREYRELTGRVQESDIIAYQIRQSFKPGEVTPEEANRIGYEFAKRFLKGRHAFLVCTHTDKKHIHNHIYWNSTALDLSLIHI